MYSEKIKEKICKIKKLKLDNYLNNYFIHKTFYSTYKSPKAKRITSSPNKIKNNENKICLSLLRTQNAKIFKTKSKSTNRLIGFNTNYKLYSPLITRMMTGGIDSTKYDSTKYTLNKKENKKYFGLSGNTIINNENTLYSTSYKIKNFENINDNDKKTFEEIFIDSFRNKNLKNNFYDKYNINNELT